MLKFANYEVRVYNEDMVEGDFQSAIYIVICDTKTGTKFYEATIHGDIVRHILIAVANVYKFRGEIYYKFPVSASKTMLTIKEVSNPMVEDTSEYQYILYCKRHNRMTTCMCLDGIEALRVLESLQCEHL